ncbi:MAG: methyltransferase domain-containing protein [Chlorobi bacterium]|nr:methyltransferase domain-containing protein [Chlorobiota bacterium]
MIKYFLKKLNKRSEEDLRLHYEVEKSIAEKLKKATKNERKVIYRTMYDELFEKIPNHSRLQRRASSSKTKKTNNYNIKFLKKHLNGIKSFCEFAPGDGKLSIKISEFVEKVYSIDISNQLLKDELIPENMELIIYDGYNLNIKKETIDLVFSNQLIEHFHPDETETHFKIVYDILKPKGSYIFKTPHNFSGPWDISRYFSNTPQGFHLKEWTYFELIKLMKSVGFKNFKTYYYAKYFFFRLPVFYFIFFEKIFSVIPKSLRRIISFPFLPHIAIKTDK